jgi:hypothetical protein
MAELATDVPKTWQVKTFVKFDNAKMPAISVFNAEAKLSKASLVGANTVKDALGSLKAACKFC